MEWILVVGLVLGLIQVLLLGAIAGALWLFIRSPESPTIAKRIRNFIEPSASITSPTKREHTRRAIEELQVP